MQYFYDMPVSGSIRSDQLRDELMAAGINPQPPYDEIVCATDNVVVIIDGISEADSVLAEPIVAAHIPQKFYTDYDRAIDNMNKSSSLLRSYLADILDQSPIDSSYAIMARSIAHEAGYSQQDIMDIIDRQSAEAFISLMPEWSALPASTRNFLVIYLRGMARVLQLLHIVLLGQFPRNV